MSKLQLISKETKQPGVRAKTKKRVCDDKKAQGAKSRFT